MSKSKHKYNSVDDSFDDGVRDNHKPRNRRKEKRIDRALRTLDIDELTDLEDEGLDPEQYFYDQELVNYDDEE